MIKEGKNSKGINYIQFGRKRFKYTTTRGKQIALHKIQKLQQGTGILDTRDTLKPSAQKLLDEFGDIPIQAMQVCREVIGHHDTIRGAMKLINFLRGHKDSSGADKLFHLYLIVKLDNQKIFKYEKNQELNIELYSPVGDTAEFRNLNVPNGLTMRKMYLTTLKKYGIDRVHHYTADFQNCQRFALDNLIANDFKYPSEVKQFIIQNTNELVDSWTKKLMVKITNLSNIFGKFKD